MKIGMSGIKMSFFRIGGYASLVIASLSANFLLSPYDEYMPSGEQTLDEDAAISIFGLNIILLFLSVVFGAYTFWKYRQIDLILAVIVIANIVASIYWYISL
ncbi:hypothetical protein [Chryseolinea lacunae]|uniref:Uncharacterized protein n=1 Tax=Chryseolinea lacunae TaxID=2801331 RepID=A0ABS1L047_9BACT|nr:hypothetical protein [Chryseolinea lacunae]MBL0744808.1 hypothetical protein [Chryseolinea lacunae]